jgi:hypothetical protein
MRDAMRAHRKALDDATDATRSILGPRSNDAFRSEIASTLHAAGADDDTGRLLRTGRLTTEAPFQGFPDAVGLTLVPEPAEAKRPTTHLAPKHRAPKENGKPTERSRDAQAEAEAEAEAQEREAAAAERERTARRKANLAARDVALRRATKADADATKARARVAKLENELEDARRALDEAEDRSRAANDEIARSEADADDASARTSP